MSTNPLTHCIFDVHDELIRRLSQRGDLSSVSDRFAHAESVAEQIRLVHRVIVYDVQIMPDPLIVQYKNEEAAEKLRADGNKLFGLRGMHLVRALEMYNRSLCMSPLKSQSYAIALANRSAVYFELKLYDSCLTSMRQALATGVYPERLKDKLAKRQADCMRVLTAERKDREKQMLQSRPINPTFERHERVRCAINCLQVRHTPEFGRHVVTTERLEPGQLIAIETAYTQVLSPAQRFQRCWHCLRENGLSLLPCYCTAVMFCGQACRRAANDTYHAYECPMIDGLLAIFGRIPLLALRTVVLGIRHCGNRRLSDMRDWMCRHREPVDAFSPPIENQTDEQRAFHQLYSLQSNVEQRTLADRFQRSTVVAVMYEMLMRYSPFRMQTISADAQNTLMELLYHFLMVCATNFHGMQTVESKLLDDDQYGSAAFAFSSLLNHSCAPNVMRGTIGTQNLLMALRRIEPGQQLFDNYGFHHALESVQLRRQSLSQQYRFECRCEACVNDYPQFINYPPCSLPDIIKPEDTKRLEAYDDYCDDLYMKYAVYLSEYDAHYPSMQLSRVQEYMKMCLYLRWQNVPLVLLTTSPYTIRQEAPRS